ncbi:MAG: DUF2652 domain-containing protein [Chloroflexi bacterium]|nr:MAG: DUF2652 domain-containing protein [Chloroflexota bacterium]
MIEERAFSKAQEGLLVLADISGYTAFVTQTEMDHSWEILHELLEVMVHSAQGKMEVSQVEGDAILFISGLEDEEVVKTVEDTFIGFHRRRRDMVAVTTCPCNACQQIGILKLKFVIHRGKFSRQRLGGVEQLHGSDVIVPHRLAKNRVPTKEYLLATDAVLNRLSEERQRRFTPYEETFDLGVVKAGYESLGHLWERELAGERKEVKPEEALIDSTVIVDVPIDLVSELILRPEVIERYMLATKVEAFAGARGGELGTVFHCHHGYGVNFLRVIASDKGRQLTLGNTGAGGVMFLTMHLASHAENQTSIRRLWWWDQPANAEDAANTRLVVAGVARAGDEAMRTAFR